MPSRPMPSGARWADWISAAGAAGVCAPAVPLNAAAVSRAMKIVRTRLVMTTSPEGPRVDDSGTTKPPTGTNADGATAACWPRLSACARAGGEIKRRTDGNDPGWIDRAVALVIVPPDMFEIHRRSDAGPLI